MVNKAMVDIPLMLHGRQLGFIRYWGHVLEKVQLHTLGENDAFHEWLSFGEIDNGQFMDLLRNTAHIERGYVELSTLVPPVPAVPLNPPELLPKINWLYDRLQVINQHIVSRLKDDKPLPRHWVRERNELIDSIEACKAEGCDG